MSEKRGAHLHEDRKGNPVDPKGPYEKKCFVPQRELLLGGGFRVHYWRGNGSVFATKIYSNDLRNSFKSRISISEVMEESFDRSCPSWLITPGPRACSTCSPTEQVPAGLPVDHWSTPIFPNWVWVKILPAGTLVLVPCTRERVVAKVDGPTGSC